jgi:hypothetical protein
MASGFFALLDDIAAIAKAAASSLDDIAVQTIQAGKKTAGIVIDDAAVTPRYVVGFAAERELPIIARIAWGSLKNKLLYLLPGAVVLSYFAPWAITPLLMAGGLFLCFEGYEKVHHLMHPEPAAGTDAGGTMRAVESEDQKIASAIRTDFILSAEIMAITLAAVEAPGFWQKAMALAVVGTLVTVAVYGAVALIVKADDLGLHLAQRGASGWVRRLGMWIVQAMPRLLTTLSLIGMAAMLWVGGGILLHGLDEYGLGAVPHAIHGIAQAVGRSIGPLTGVITRLIDAVAAGVIGLALGWLTAMATSRLRPAHHADAE